MSYTCPTCGQPAGCFGHMTPLTDVPAPVAAQPGWKLVPVEPTEAMVTAFAMSYRRHSPHVALKAAIAAAPNPPAWNGRASGEAEDRGALVLHAIKLMRQMEPWDGKTFSDELTYTLRLLAAPSQSTPGADGDSLKAAHAAIANFDNLCIAGIDDAIDEAKSQAFYAMLACFRTKLEPAAPTPAAENAGAVDRLSSLLTAFVGAGLPEGWGSAPKLWPNPNWDQDQAMLALALHRANQLAASVIAPVAAFPAAHPPEAVDAREVIVQRAVEWLDSASDSDLELVFAHAPALAKRLTAALAAQAQGGAK